MPKSRFSRAAPSAPTSTSADFGELALLAPPPPALFPLLVPLLVPSLEPGDPSSIPCSCSMSFSDKDFPTTGAGMNVSKTRKSASSYLDGAWFKAAARFALSSASALRAFALRRAAFFALRAWRFSARTRALRILFVGNPVAESSLSVCTAPVWGSLLAEDFTGDDGPSDASRATSGFSRWFMTPRLCDMATCARAAARISAASRLAGICDATGDFLDGERRGFIGSGSLITARLGEKGSCRCRLALIRSRGFDDSCCAGCCRGGGGASTGTARGTSAPRSADCMTSAPNPTPPTFSKTRCCCFGARLRVGLRPVGAANDMAQLQRRKPSSGSRSH